MTAPARLPGLEPPLPHILAPLPDESLLGYLFRLDRTNAWEPGTVATLLCTHRTGWKHASAAMWASGTIFDLRRLANLVDLPYEVVAGLTYLPDIRAASRDPELAVHALGDSGQLQFCPACLSSTGTIPRPCLLPLMLVCPVHRVRLVRHCGGHAPLLPAVDLIAGRITCEECGADLASISGEPPSEELLAHQLDVWRAWSFLLGWRGDDIRGRGYRTIRSRTRNYPLRNLGETASFERLVTVFLALQIEPDMVAELEDRPRPPCPNAACPDHVPPSAGDPLLRGRPVERHCPTCGCRFIGRRILLSFDADHGAEQPSPRSVDRAQRRLARWREDLAEACRQDILAGRRITVTGTFRRAGVPANANLRASRLGLVDLVRDAARRQRLADGSEPAATAATTMAESHLYLTFSRSGSWDQLATVAALGGVRPNRRVRALEREPDDDRRFPSEYVLDRLFPPRWVARNDLEPEALLAMVVDAMSPREGPTDPLSERWRRRVHGFCRSGIEDTVVSSADYPIRTRPQRLGPTTRDLILSEWCPPWMPHHLDEDELVRGAARTRGTMTLVCHRRAGTASDPSAQCR